MKNNPPVIGTHVQSAEISIAEQMGILGYEFVWIEGEHSPLDKQNIQVNMIACKAGNTAAFVRIPWNDPVLAKPILEMGPDGIVFPFISSAKEARAAVAACQYPPKGIRGFGPRRANGYGTMPNAEYLAGVDASFLKIMQIEHIDAVDNLEEILAVDGVDTVVAGPNDLSGSLGLLGQTRHPDVLKQFDRMAEKCNRAGVPFGVSTGMLDRVTITEWLNRGVGWISIGNEASFISQAGSETLKTVREMAKK